MTDQLEMDEVGFTPTDILDGEQCQTLGPAYFAGRRIAGEFTAKFAGEMFEPLIKEFSDKLYDQAREAFEVYLLSDTESNLTSSLYRMVDQTVNALLTGEQWALERYPLAKYHDGRKVREAIFAQCRDQIEAARIAELEVEVADLKKTLDFYRR